MRENLGGVVVRLGVFLAVCLLTAFLLIAVFGEVRFGDGKTYYAEFANVSNLRTGKLVRIAGVEVGKVTRISINPDATVRVQFTADNSVTLTRGTRAVTAIWRWRKGPADSPFFVPVTRFRWRAPNRRWIWMP